jgi:hypothetical protein
LDEVADSSEVKDVFMYLASDESKEVNGQRFEAQEENWAREPEVARLGAA